MIKTIVIAAIACLLLFEFIEHAVFPLIWLLMSRRRKSPCGPEGLIGEVATVQAWEGSGGRVSIHGELWSAAGGAPLYSGDKAIVESIEGLTLRVAPFKHTTV